jgi:hypothetical protein
MKPTDVKKYYGVRLAKQRSEHSCVRACVAMLTGVSEKKLTDVLPLKKRGQGMAVDEAVDKVAASYLYDIGYDPLLEGKVITSAEELKGYYGIIVIDGHAYVSFPDGRLWNPYDANLCEWKDWYGSDSDAFGLLFDEQGMEALREAGYWILRDHRSRELVRRELAA